MNQELTKEEIMERLEELIRDCKREDVKIRLVRALEQVKITEYFNDNTLFMFQRCFNAFQKRGDMI